MADTTMTLYTGPACTAPGKAGKKAVYKAVLGADNWLAAGVALDFTGEFSYITNANCSLVDTAADASYKFDIVCAPATAITSSNVKLVGNYSTDAAGAFTPIPDATDLSAIGTLMITVEGK